MLAEESTPLPWGPPVIQVTSLIFASDLLMIINPPWLCRVRSRSRNQLFLHNRGTRIYNCQWGWRNWDMRKARSLVTKLSRNQLSPMLQLSIWKVSQERLLNIEFLEGPAISVAESNGEAAEWKPCDSEFPGRLIQGNSGRVEIAGGQRAQCRGGTSLCQAFRPKADLV